MHERDAALSSEVRCQGGRGCRGLVAVVPWPRWSLKVRVVETSIGAATGGIFSFCPKCRTLHEMQHTNEGVDTTASGHVA